MFRSVALSQRDFFQYFAREAAPPQIDLAINLTHYGMVETPLKAVYGQITAFEVSEWYKNYGNFLFSGNIRHFLGMKSDVNGAIRQTVTATPENFWYYNNGITLLVDSLTRRPIGSADRSIGVFDCKNVTIVNGAQTVGTIGRSEIKPENSAVLQARIIVVTDPESRIGNDITRASNTQNKIDARNFVVLDPEQDRIRTELLLDGINYEYREGEPLESLASGFDFIEAVTTLACASNEMSYVGLAKGYVGGLYIDIQTTPYKALFNTSTRSRHLWNLVQLSRRFDQQIKSVYDVDSPLERGITVHGNRFSLHCAFRLLRKLGDLDVPDAITDDTIRSAATKILHGMRDIIDAKL